MMFNSFFFFLVLSLHSASLWRVEMLFQSFREKAIKN